MRCFVGIGLTEPVLDAIERLQAGLPVGRAVPRESLHLTLAFLDDLKPRQIEALHDGLSEIHLTAPELHAGEFELFEPARFLALGVEPVPELVALQRAVAQAARQAEIVLERRRFRPHVTLARFRARMEPGDACRLAQWLEVQGRWLAEDRPVPPMRAAAFTLYASELRPEGARYTALSYYPLG